MEKRFSALEAGKRLAGILSRSRHGTEGNLLIMVTETTSRYAAGLNEHDDIIQRDVRTIREIVGTSSMVLEVGCGIGSFLSECEGQIRIGVDLSQQAALLCKNHGHCVVLADGRHLPHPCGTFDVVRSKEVLEHIPQPLEMVDEMRRVLRSGGLLVCHVPTHWSMLYPLGANFWDDYTHVRPFSKQGIERLLEDGGFRIFKTEGYTSPKDWWQRPFTPILSHLLPFSWRVLALADAAEQ
jgi:SAM-dependent methyltransferase